jgi:hypothetical protein
VVCSADQVASPEGSLFGTVRQHHPANSNVSSLLNFHEHPVTQRLQLWQVISHRV